MRLLTVFVSFWSYAKFYTAYNAAVYRNHAIVRRI